MRASGVRGFLVYCSDYYCSHWTPISGDKRPDDVRLSDIEPCFTCQGCGRRGRMDATFLIGTRPLAEAKGSSCRSKNQGGDYRA
jgi:hypothetical protein